MKIIVIKPPEMITALESSQIDAFIAWEPHATKAVTKGVGRVLISSSQIWKGHPCCVVAFEGSVAHDRPAVVQAFLRAHAKATAFILANTGGGGPHRRAVHRDGREDRPGRPSATSPTAPRLERAPVREYASYLARLGYIKETDPDAILRDYLDPAGLAEGRPALTSARRDPA